MKRRAAITTGAQQPQDNSCGVSECEARNQAVLVCRRTNAAPRIRKTNATLRASPICCRNGDYFDGTRRRRWYRASDTNSGSGGQKRCEPRSRCFRSSWLLLDRCLSWSPREPGHCIPSNQFARKLRYAEASSPAKSTRTTHSRPFAQRRMIATLLFCGSRTPGPVDARRSDSAKPRIVMRERGTPLRTNSPATASARHTERV